MGKKEDISRRDLLKTGGAVAAAVAATSLLPAAASAAKEGVSRWAVWDTGNMAGMHQVKKGRKRAERTIMTRISRPYGGKTGAFIPTG